jgi:hypothetical protein
MGNVLNPMGILHPQEIVAAAAMGDERWKFSRNLNGCLPNVTTVTQDVQDQGGIMVFPSAEGAITLSSSSVNDTVGGSGAQAVTLVGLNQAYGGGFDPEPWQFTQVPLNGQNDVSTSDQGATGPSAYFRVVDAFVSAGSVNEGIITISHGTDVQRTITPGFGRSLSTHHAIPAGFRGFITPTLSLNWGAASSVRVECFSMTLGLRTLGVAGTFSTSTIVPGFIGPFPPKTDLWCTARRLTTGGTDEVDIITTILITR